MNTIKEYKQLTYIECFDGEIRIIETPIETVQLLLKEEQFLNLGKELINKSNIKRVFIKEIDEVDNAVLQILDKDLRMRVQAEIDKRRKEWNRVNMEIFRNILNRLSE